jgi:hypothetical protein
LTTWDKQWEDKLLADLLQDVRLLRVYLFRAMFDVSLVFSGTVVEFFSIRGFLVLLANLSKA